MKEKKKTKKKIIISRMNVNEPFVIEETTADGKYYWGMNTNCSGWVEAENFAICDYAVALNSYRDFTKS